MHARALADYVGELRDALALARATRRTLVLPRWTCYCDRLWSGSDDIFHFGCMYPGSQDAPFVPFVCPMDHVLSPAAWAEAGVAYRDASYLEGASPAPEVVEVQVGAAGGAAGGARGPAQLRLGISDAEAARALQPFEAAPVLRLSTARGLLCGLDLPPAELAAHNALAARLLRPPDWCSTCFQKCEAELAKWLQPEAIRAGADGERRWCARFQPPPPLRAVTEGCAATASTAS